MQSFGWPQFWTIKSLTKKGDAPLRSTFYTRSRKGLEKPRGFHSVCHWKIRSSSMPFNIFWKRSNENAMGRNQLRGYWEASCFSRHFFPPRLYEANQFASTWRLTTTWSHKASQYLFNAPFQLKLGPPQHTQNAIWHSLAHFTNNLTTHNTWPLKICMTPSSNSNSEFRFKFVMACLTQG